MATILRFVSRARRAAQSSFAPSRCSIFTTAHRLADPWPLPGSPEHLASTETPSDEARIQPLERPNESLGTLRARLVYQSRKRGTLESDLLLSTFARDNLKNMSEEELKQYDKLLDEPDWDIYYWATGKRTPPDRWASTALLEKLKVHARNEGKVVRRMPSL
ncbi:Flavinator of succinate dehydrogenase-domain-containing protein [Lentinula detonsa]|uniref:Succinate dehydrogenase assembly factor 2, mitochondrial n=1 Tax=Lentinula detonsa TaxID=2804962 RepID=A0AA38UQC9_9AGAR|nr:Flavinator of succinate dehydrogenase-domain-containing protein [Lentinula detonsa]